MFNEEISKQTQITVSFPLLIKIISHRYILMKLFIKLELFQNVMKSHHVSELLVGQIHIYIPNYSIARDENVWKKKEDHACPMRLVCTAFVNVSKIILISTKLVANGFLWMKIHWLLQLCLPLFFSFFFEFVHPDEPDFFLLC